MTLLAERERFVESMRPMAESTPDWELASVSWENSPNCLFILRVEEPDTFVFEGLNPAVERQTGLRNAVLVGRRVEEVIEPAPAAAVLGRYRQCVRHDAPISYFET